MALRYFHRGQWLKTSVAKARVLRRKGIEIVDTSNPQIEDLIDAGGPPADPVEMPGAVSEQTSDEIEMRERAATARPMPIARAEVAHKCSVCGEPGHTKAKCPLAELDALTTPES